MKKTIENYRQGEPALELYTYDTATPPEYIIKPLIMKDVPNIIFADQESLKTQTAIFACILSLLGNEAPPINGLEVQVPPFTGDILFLDWENNANSTLWNLKKIRLGLNIEYDLSVVYLSCDLPLDQNLDRIREIFKKRKIILTIIDSLGLAAGGELKDSTRATNFYAALRSLKTTSLILAHTSKSLDSKKTVFGSAYFEFLSRNIWEAQREEVDPRQHRLALHHHKSNYGKYPALGLEYTFDVDRTYIKSFNPIDEPTFREKMSISIRIQKELENGDYTSSELAEILTEKLNSVDHAAKRLEVKKLVDKLSNGKWHLHTS